MTYSEEGIREARDRRNRLGADGMSPIAIVTASDSGIGQETTKELAEKGYDVGITYHEDEVGAKETLAAVEEMNRRGEVRRYR
jgi:NAD(P)-dependent dehydrogenase (short-subunit alcohol dehydrogenase family)